MNKIKWIGIIPLIGGFPLGAYKAIGHKPEVLISWKAFAANDKHIKAHWPDVPFHVMDNNDDITYLRDSIDIAVLTPPCSALSSLNPKSSVDYGSIKWVYESITLAIRLGVKAIILENAPRLYSKKGEPVADKLYELAVLNGYSTSLAFTDTLCHGLPQRRQRTFVCLWKGQSAPILEWENIPNISLENYLKQVPIEASYQDIFYNKESDLTKLVSWHFAKKLFNTSIHESINGQFISIFLKNKDYKLIREYIEFAKANPHLTDSRHAINNYERLERKLVENKGIWEHSFAFPKNGIVQAAQGKVVYSTVHPTEDRWINLREWMHLMGLPHDFNLINPTSVSSKYAVTQNVTTHTAKWITSEAVAWINGRREDGGYRFIKQDNLKKTIVKMHPTDSIEEL